MANTHERVQVCGTCLATVRALGHGLRSIGDDQNGRPTRVWRLTLSCICHDLAVVGKRLDALYKEGAGAFERSDRLIFLFLFQQAVGRGGIVCLSGQSVCMRDATRRDRRPHLAGRQGTMSMVTWCPGRVDSDAKQSFGSEPRRRRRRRRRPSIMPVTRSSSRQASQPPPAIPFASRRAGPSGSRGSKKASKPPSNQIIVLSSDDDEPPPKGTLSSKKSPGRTTRRNPAASAAAPVLFDDVLEISSDDESKPKKTSMRKRTQTSQTTNKDLERTIKRLQEVCVTMCILSVSEGPHRSSSDRNN